jgi:hypothetical protein
MRLIVYARFDATSNPKARKIFMITLCDAKNFITASEKKAVSEGRIKLSQKQTRQPFSMKVNSL